MVASATIPKHSATSGGKGDVVNVPKDVLPSGKYTLVGVDIDTTGRRLIDEIVQLAAYNLNDHFEQYIMPYMNLNPAARQRHQVRVISIGFYRMLKSMQSYKIIKSKSEIAALKDFLDWLEALKAKDANSQGIILVYHEERKFIPYMILESLKKYSLLDRFGNSVKSFANGHEFVKANSNESLRHYSLRKLAKILAAKHVEENNNDISNDGQKSTQKIKTSFQADRDLFDGNASVRAKLAFDVALQLSNKDGSDHLESANALNKMFESLKSFAYPIGCDLRELETQNANLERQNSFRPVFLNYFKTTLYHRVRAVRFRIVLAEHGFDLQDLNNIWLESNRRGLTEALQAIDGLKSDDKNELIDLFDSYFDPSKATIKPVIKNTSSRRRNRRTRTSKNDGNYSARSSNNEHGASGDKSQGSSSVPDSTTKSPSQTSENGTGIVNGSGGSRPQRKRHSRGNIAAKLPAPISTQTSPNVAAVQSPVTQIPIAASN